MDESIDAIMIIRVKEYGNWQEDPWSATALCRDAFGSKGSKMG